MHSLKTRPKGLDLVFKYQSLTRAKREGEQNRRKNDVQKIITNLNEQQVPLHLETSPTTISAILEGNSFDQLCGSLAFGEIVQQTEWLESVKTMIGGTIVCFKKKKGAIYTMAQISPTPSLVREALDEKLLGLEISVIHTRDSGATDSEFAFFVDELNQSKINPDDCPIFTSMQGPYLYIFHRTGKNEFLADRRSLKRKQIAEAESLLLLKADYISNQLQAEFPRDKLPGFTNGLNLYLGLMHAFGGDLHPAVMREIGEFYDEVVSEGSRHKATRQQLARAYAGTALCACLQYRWQEAISRAKDAQSLFFQENRTDFPTQQVQLLKHWAEANFCLKQSDEAVRLLDEGRKLIVSQASEPIGTYASGSLLITDAVIHWTLGNKDRASECYKRILKDEDIRTIGIKWQLPKERHYFNQLTNLFSAKGEVAAPYLIDAAGYPIEREVAHSTINVVNTHKKGWFRRVSFRLTHQEAEVLRRAADSPDALTNTEWVLIEGVAKRGQAFARESELRKRFEDASKLIDDKQLNGEVDVKQLNDFFARKHQDSMPDLKRTKGEILPDEKKIAIVELVRAFQALGGSVFYDGNRCNLLFHKAPNTLQGQFHVYLSRGERKKKWSSIKIPLLSFE